jgi:SAM-dependent methyltransferase
MDGNSTYVERRLDRFEKLRKFVVGESKTTILNCGRFKKELFKVNKKPKVLIIGGGAKGSGAESLWEDKNIEIHSVDIYGSETVDVICDAHYLPLASNAYDGVWIQAVMEHVVEPVKVADEIYRVLKKNGIIYAETPFMQQVHEGAYDFTRYTVLGHRYLFKKFEARDLGGNKGPELVLAWSLRYLTWSVFRSRKLARLVGLFFGIALRPLGYLVSKASMWDASSGVYFLGRKSSKREVTHKELVKLYKGQFR